MAAELDFATEERGYWGVQAVEILIEPLQPDPLSDPIGYAVGVAEVWTDFQTGEQAGTYLHMADAPHQERAEQMRENIYRMADEAEISDHQLGNFARDLIKGRSDWQPLTEAQWELVDNRLNADTPDWDREDTWNAREELLAQAFEQAEGEQNMPNFEQAISNLGLQVAQQPPHLWDEKTQTAYWIGVYQDPQQPDQAVTAILSLKEDDAQLAPVALGDPDHAQQTANYLLKVAERSGDLGRVLDAAEGMAVATQHRELWAEARELAATHAPDFAPLSLEMS